MLAHLLDANQLVSVSRKDKNVTLVLNCVTEVCSESVNDCNKNTKEENVRNVRVNRVKNLVSVSAAVRR